MDLEKAWQRLFFTRRRRLGVYRKLERLLSNNIKMDRALESIWHRAAHDGQKPQRGYAPIIAEWQRRNRDGDSFGRIVAEWVPHSEQMLIEAGEAAGDIPNALNRAIELAESAGEIRKTLISSLAYPIVLIFATIAMLAGFSWKMVPTFATILPPEQWTGIAASIYGLSQFINDWFFVIVIGITAAIVACISTMGSLTGPTRVFLDRIPPWSLYRIWQGAGFLTSVSSLLEAGVPVPNALRRMRANANPYMRERIEGTVYFVNEGDNFGVALKNAGYGFPDNEIIDEMSVYAPLTGFSEAIGNISRRWVKEAVGQMTAMSRALNIAMLFIMAGCIMWMVGGMFDLMQQVNQAVRY